MTPQERLEDAAAKGDLEGIRKAINDGAAPKSGDSPAFRWAARNGHAECVKELIPVSNPETGRSWALRSAVYNGHTECVRLLIPVSDPKANDSQALRWAAENGHVECVKLLLPVSDVEAVKRQASSKAISLMDSIILRAKHLPAENKREGRAL